MFPDGRRYEGEYINDRRHGFGEYTDENGIIYRGEWQSGVQHGICYMILPNGTYKKALFENGSLKENMDISEDEIDLIKEMKASGISTNS